MVFCLCTRPRTREGREGPSAEAGPRPSPEFVQSLSVAVVTKAEPGSVHTPSGVKSARATREDEAPEESDIVTPLGRRHRERASRERISREDALQSPKASPQPASGAPFAHFSIASQPTEQGSPARPVSAADILTGAVATQGLLRTPRTSARTQWLPGSGTYTAQATNLGTPPASGASLDADGTPTTPQAGTPPPSYLSVVMPSTYAHSSPQWQNSAQSSATKAGLPSPSAHSVTASASTPTVRPPRPSPAAATPASAVAADATPVKQPAAATPGAASSAHKKAGSLTPPPTSITPSTAHAAKAPQQQQQAHVSNPYGFYQVYGTSGSRSRGSGMAGAHLSGAAHRGAPGTASRGAQVSNRSGRGLPSASRGNKLGSASSRVALSGLLSQSSITSTDRKSTLSNLDFRPKWR